MSTNQQASATGTAAEQHNSPAKAPVKGGKGTPEKTYTKEEYDRIDNQRRELQRKLDSTERKNKQLQSDNESLTALTTELDVALKENYTEDSLRDAVKNHAKKVAADKQVMDRFNVEREEVEERLAVAEEKTLKEVRQKWADEYGCPVEVLDGIKDHEQIEFMAFKNRTKEAGKVSSDVTVAAPESQADAPLIPDGAKASVDISSLSARELISRGLNK